MLLTIPVNHDIYLVFYFRDSKFHEGRDAACLVQNCFSKCPPQVFNKYFFSKRSSRMMGTWCWLENERNIGGLISLNVKDEVEWLVYYYLLFLPRPFPKKGCKEARWLEHHRTGSAKEFTSTHRHCFRRLYQKAAGWSGGGRSAKKSSGILSCLIFHLLTCTPYLGSKPKTGGSVAARKG